MKKAIISTLLTASLTINAQQYRFPFQNPLLSNEQRADDLISRLTIDEKAKLLMHYSPAIDRLGIHQFQWWGEALHGVGFAGHATVFPQAIGMAASFDDVLLRKVFDAVSDEIRAKYNKAAKTGTFDTFQSVSIWTPNINIFRDPRWGRGQETYGEDPYLMSRMGLSVVRGLQGGDGQQKYYKSFACAKHYAVHSGPEWNRHSYNIENLSPRDLWETYMPAFKTLVTQGNVREVMCAYQRFEGEPCCASNLLLHKILREEWGFDGIIVTDCDAINDFWERGHHELDPDVAHASARGISSGTDLNCGGSYHVGLPEAVRQGLVDEKKINESLRRVICGRIQLGDFDPDSVAERNNIPMSVIENKEHLKLALDMARESMTLLQNRGDILPLSLSDIQNRSREETQTSSSNSLPSLVVMGPNANDSTMQWGNYSGRPAHTVTILEGIREKAGNDNVLFIDGCGHVSKNVRTENRFSMIRNANGDTGLMATIWDNPRMEGTPVASRNFTRPVNFNLNESGFIAPGVARQNFSARLLGTFTPQETETLQFRIAGDDGFRLIIDNDTIFEEWRDQGTKYCERMINVEAGKTYQIQIDYYQGGGGAELQFDINRYRELTDEELLAQVPKEAQTVIYVGGLSSRLEGEEMSVNEPGFRGGDREDIQLPERQRKQIAALHAMDKKVILVNCSGSAIGLKPETENADAILQAWYPGVLGGRAVADVIFGDFNPCGKLPITFYQSVDQLPDFLDYNMKERTYRYFHGTPLYPFGYGMSYAEFSIGKAKYANNKLTVDVTNTGKREGTEVVQMYIRCSDDPNGPIKSLRGFERVTLQPGETKTLAIDSPREIFERFDPESNTVRVVPGSYEIMYGTSSADKDLQSLKVTIK